MFFIYLASFSPEDLAQIEIDKLNSVRDKKISQGEENVYKLSSWANQLTTKVIGILLLIVFWGIIFSLIMVHDWDFFKC